MPPSNAAVRPHATVELAGLRRDEDHPRGAGSPQARKQALRQQNRRRDVHPDDRLEYLGIDLTELFTGPRVDRGIVNEDVESSDGFVHLGRDLLKLRRATEVTKYRNPAHRLGNLGRVRKGASVTQHACSGV